MILNIFWTFYPFWRIFFLTFLKNVFRRSIQLFLEKLKSLEKSSCLVMNSHEKSWFFILKRARAPCIQCRGTVRDPWNDYTEPRNGSAVRGMTILSRGTVLGAVERLYRAPERLYSAAEWLYRASHGMSIQTRGTTIQSRGMVPPATERLYRSVERFCEPRND